MLQHYTRIAIRHLAKVRTLTFINIFGLSVGIACFSLILVYAVNEFSYDRWHKLADRIYRVNQVWTRDDGTESGDAGSNMPLGPAMKKDLPDVADDVRVSGTNQSVIKVNNQLTRMGVTYADASFFDLFSFQLLTGRDPDILKAPRSLVLTRDRAMQLFGSINVVGRRVDIKSDSSFVPFTVTGVMENIPVNSSIHFDMIGSYLTLLDNPGRKEGLNSWSMVFGDNTYVLLKPGSHLAADADHLLAFRHRYYPEEKEHYIKTKKADSRFALEPLKDLHTDDRIDAGPPEAVTNPRNVYILLAIATGILLIACINFTTLAIARSAGRAKEVGVRKVIGGVRRQLILQFITESMLITLISTIIGIALVYVLLPYFNQLSGRAIQFSLIRYPELIWMLAGMVLVVGFAAGSYPALVLSKFNPLEVLQSKFRLSGPNLFTRSLVTVQFVLSIGMIIATVVTLQQVSYMRSRDLGLVKENTVVVNIEDTDGAKLYPLFRMLVASQKEVLSVGASEMGLGADEGQMGNGYMFNEKRESVIIYPIDANFIPALGMKILAGRNFNPVYTSDSAGGIIVNEALLRNYMGVSPSEAVGMQVKALGRRDAPPVMKTIIGVVRDFNFESLNRKVRPQLFTMPAALAPRRIFVRIAPGQAATAIAAIDRIWTQQVRDLPLRYSWLDDDLDKFYRNEARWRNIFACAGIISICLACLGLFGLAALASVNRLKEIGIRKVLGASVREIVQLLCREFIVLVLIAALIASPLAWYFMSKWLQHFAYRIEMDWWLFAGTALISLLIAVCTIATQAVRAAIANPVDNLRTE